MAKTPEEFMKMDLDEMVARASPSFMDAFDRTCLSPEEALERRLAGIEARLDKLERSVRLLCEAFDTEPGPSPLKK